MFEPGGAIGMGLLPTPGTGMGGPTRLFRAEAHAEEMAFVSQNVQDVSTYSCVVAPVAPLAAHPFAPPGGFERLKRFATDERALPDGSEEQEQVGGQVREFAIARLIEAPTLVDLLRIRGSFGIVLGQLPAGGLECIALPAPACPLPIPAAGAYNQRARELHLLIRLSRIGAEHD